MNDSDLIHLALHRTAASTPDKPALRCDGTELTYGALADQASALAATLIELGIERGDRVGIWFDKSLRTPISIYGILQAGASYVPLDPGCPAARANAILSSAGCRALITQPGPNRNIPNAVEGLGLVTVIGAEAIVPGPSWAQALDASPAPTTPKGMGPDDRAYILFTSGSTGTPKGIEHTHASGFGYARMAADLYGLNATDRLSNASPAHFDMSTFDYFASALVGATTTVIPDPYLKMPASLADLIEDEALTVWYSVPLALVQLLRFGDLGTRTFPLVRQVNFGGEPFVPKHLDALRPHFPNAQFSNAYGPTELNQCTYYHVPPEWSAEDGPLPIGAPCPGSEALILDDGEEVTQGAVGELVMTAPTMMRGYWNDDARNAEAFHIENGRPFYRTGDLVRTRADGALEYLGRADRQIKTRGFRVELDCVEDILARHADVVEVATFAVRVEEGLDLIGAAVVLAQETDTTAEALTIYAQSQLEHYAMPCRIDVMADFPRTHTDKIDRMQLARAFAPPPLAEISLR